MSPNIIRDTWVPVATRKLSGRGAVLAAEFDRTGGRVVTQALAAALVGGLPSLEKVSVDVFSVV